MNLSVFGATGGLGSAVIEQALAQGHVVRAQARDPGRVSIAHERLTVVQGGIADRRSVADVIAGSQAVLWCVGVTRRQDPDVFAQGMRHVVDAMREKRVSRLLAISGAGLELPDDESSLGRTLILAALKLFSPRVLEGKRLEHQVLSTVDDLDWTLVRVARMVDKDPSGGVQIGEHAVPGKPVVAYADVATWMLEQVEDRAWVREAPFVGG